MEIYFIIFAVLIVAFATAVFLFSRHLKKKRLLQALNLKILLVRLPQKKSEQKTKEDFLKEMNLSSQLFGALAGLNSPFALEAAVHNIGEEIHFYIATSKDSIEFVSRQIEGLWSEAKIETTNDYNIFNPSGVNSGIYLKQKSSYILPIRTYLEADMDTFSTILSGLSKINEIGEGAGIQILARAAPGSAKKTIYSAIERLKKGEKIENVLKGGAINAKDIQKAVSGETKKEEKIIDSEAIKALELKMSKPLLAVNFRVLVSSPSQYQTNAILEGISGGIAQFSAPSRQELKIIKPRDLNNLIYQFSFREFDDSQSMILNTEELTSMFHLPSFSTEVPKINWLKSKEAPPPANLPSKGTLIGESFFRGERKSVYVSEDDRRLHVYAIGQTGTGKSTLMTNMAVEDIRQGKGIAVVDPHGDLIEKILGLIPEKRFEDVIVFDPSDRWRPLGLNMLECDLNRPEEKTFIANEMQGIFNKLFLAETMGPMFEQYMKNALLLLMEDSSPPAGGPATLMEVARVFTDLDFRERKLSRASNPVVIDFWRKEAVKAGGEAALSNMTPYITSKFNNFTANDYMRPIIGQSKSAFNFRDVMDEGKILLVNLSKGKIGDINANLLGMVIVGKILMSALSRADVVKEKRRDFNLYIDEFQNFTTDSISTILSEARKYGLNLTVAHQFIAQLNEKIRDSIFGNAGSIISFRVGPQDAEFLTKQFSPTFNENDLMNIDNFNAHARILINGQTSKPFNIRTVAPEAGNSEVGERLKEMSRQKYGRDRQEVEDEILKRLRG